MFKYKNVLIYGYSTSGKAVEKVLIEWEVNYKIYDDNMGLGGGKYLFKLKKEDIKKFDLIVISPAISIFNKYIKYAESEGIRVISELEFGYLLCPYPIIAVTGTNGKTTVTKLIEHILNSSGYSAKALGNVGEPLTDVRNYDKLDFAVVEVSSFQLEATYKFKPYIGVLLNVDADHIDRHKTLENYINLKLSLFKNCNAECFAIVNNQPEILNGMKDCLVKQIVLNKDCNVVNNKIIFNEEEIFDLSEIKNFTYLENILAVVSVLKIIGLNNNEILNGINSFKNLEHRVEFVSKINNVSYYDDSKATNPHATIGATNKLKNFSQITLLLGGKNKNLNFDDLMKHLPQNVTKIVAFGESRKKIAKSSKNKIETFVEPNLKGAIFKASKITKSGDAVLLSPACASFDEFSSYIERGNYFKQIVGEIKNIYTMQNLNGEIC